MIVKNIKIKNFKSFGNNVSEVKLNTNDGEVILLTGQNGAGKSSILDCVDFALFGKVRGKKKKYVSTDTLPNRYNGDMIVELEFETTHNHIKIVRAGTKVELWIDYQKYDRAGKANIQNKIDEIIGIDIDTFKSFISMSINDFKNFMVLTPEEKRMLLDRLFNLEMITDLTNILKEKKKQNKYQHDLFLSEVSSYEKSLNSINYSIEKLKQASMVNLEKEREEVKKLIHEKRSVYEAHKENLVKANGKEQKLVTQIRTLQKRDNEISFQIKSFNNKIALLDSGKCHTCESDLSAEFHQAHKKELLETLSKTKEIKLEVEKELVDLDMKYSKFKQIVSKTEQSYGELTLYLNQLKTKLSSMKDDNVASETASINELLGSIERIEVNKTESEDKLDDTKHRSDLLDQLGKVFSEDGIKKSIIAKIVKPINHFIKENVELLQLNFGVELDDQFSAKITVLGQEIDVDSMSSGEVKLCNLAILVSYLKLIRMKKHINLLFLDEVFATVDVSNIYLVLNMFKSFAKEYNVNVFLVHHALLEKSYFDRVLKIEKNITSQIIEED
jgi:DNA repair exonuclease SbcCD ATPase subunit